MQLERSSEPTTPVSGNLCARSTVDTALEIYHSSMLVSHIQIIWRRRLHENGRRRLSFNRSEYSRPFGLIIHGAMR